MQNRVAIGSDHGGLALKYELMPLFKEEGWTADDVGCFSLDRDGRSGLSYEAATGRLVAAESVDYPDFARRVVEQLLDRTVTLGILICGTGIGMCIAANKFQGIRAALCADPYSAQMAREHNDANVLCLGGRVIGPEMARAVTRAFLQAGFGGGRHERRLNKIRAIETENTSPTKVTQ